MKVQIGNYRKSGQTVKVSIDNFDTYSLDHTLAYIILPALLALKDQKMGIPNELVADVGGEDWTHQDSFDFYKESHKEAFDLATKRWDEILDKMIWSFRQILLEDYEENYHHGKAKFKFEKTDKLFHNPVTGQLEETYEMIDKNPNDHWYDHVGHQLHDERIQEGLELFGKYYRHLWT